MKEGSSKIKIRLFPYVENLEALQIKSLTCNCQERTQGGGEVEIYV